MIEDDLERLCSPKSPPIAKCAALRKVLRGISSNFLESTLLFQRFAEVCAILFGAEGKPGLIEESKIASDLLPLLDPSSTGINLPSILLQVTSGPSSGGVAGGSPYFILDAAKLPVSETQSNPFQHLAHF